MADETKVVSIDADVEAARADLSTFLANNPSSCVERRGRAVVVREPWGDSTLVLRIDRTDRDLIEALTAVHLPPRHSALWHSDTRDLEFIYTALPITNPSKTRAFRIQVDGTELQCEFARSSDRLMKIAVSSRPIEPPTDTAHRNLESYFQYHHHTRDHPDSDLAKEGEPISFWIRAIEFEDNRIVEFSRLLNFYMSYFDPGTPQILIHSPAASGKSKFKNPFSRPVEFPAVLRARPIDPYLLSLWESSRNATDPFRRFIYLYQMLEYCAFYHVQEDVLRVIRRAVLSPDAPSRISQIARQVLDAVVEDRMQEAQKFVAGVERCVDPRQVWVAVQPNADLFSEEISFDGGFCLPPLINANWSEGDFCRAWNPKFADSLRKIRNALVHAREARQVGIIAPTNENYLKLAPWLPPLQVAAEGAMLFGSDT